MKELQKRLMRDFEAFGFAALPMDGGVGIV
jgi:hypothetical protein